MSAGSCESSSATRRLSCLARCMKGLSWRIQKKAWQGGGEGQLNGCERLGGRGAWRLLQHGRPALVAG